MEELDYDATGQKCMAGCTANVILLTKDMIYCANAGDSRSILRTKQ